MLFYFRISSAVLLVALFFAAGCAIRNPIRPLTAMIVRSGDLALAGNAAMERGNWDEAEKKLKEAIRLNPDEVETRLNYAEILWIVGKRKDALTVLYEAAEQSSKPAEKSRVAASAAEKLLVLEQNDVALSWAEQCVREAPLEYRGWWLRARALMRIGNEYDKNGEREAALKFYSDSCESFYRSLAYQPPERELLPELATVQMQMSENEHALATWQNLLRLYQSGDEPINAICAKGDTLALLGRVDDAAGCFQTAAAREPNNIAICLRYAELESQAGRVEQAQQILSRANCIAPNNPAVLNLATKIQGNNKSR
ncbi:MAG: tetratricopeptide repeat protein [Planctomycetaceae bacterium]|jgi:tetratricopeptide (TPR) repeat protein|nr:tetratricopeptide repeat protein [Planctomycetaceae bacterium]